LKIIAASFLTFFYNDIIAHIPVQALRSLFLRLFNRKISPSAKILMHTRILGLWNVEIGDRVVINQYCLLDGRRHKVIIKHDTDIGPYTRIWTSGHKPDSDTHELYGGDVIILDHVWIASGVTILPDVTIGRGAVVGAASLVHKSVDEFHIVAGNPIHFIRRRNNALEYRLTFNPYFE
jgi:putative colanic acid biosynthesis acetyltransferase WcaF